MATLEFVNHASYIVHYNNIHLITDPWIEGTAFHDGWQLIEPTKFSYTDFANITHIWFSHEHPDHFSPPNLKRIPAAIRANITVLFQKTKDKKVIRFCEQLNFKACIELSQTWLELAPGFKLLNVPHTDGDSWLCIKAGERTILNLNDCVFDNVRQIQHMLRKTGPGPVDVLLTQFSYANWVGNAGDTARHKKHAEKKLAEITKQVSLIKPAYTIPFASYIWFCHAENFYMNHGANKPAAVFAHLQKLDTKPIVLFTGEKWDIGKDYQAEISVNKWMESYNRNILPEKTTGQHTVADTQLMADGNKFIVQLVSANTFWMKLFLKPTRIYITDYQSAYCLSLKGFDKCEVPEQDCDIALGSDAMAYCFNHLWGGATTRINGRYQVPRNGRFYNWKMYFQTAELNNHGKIFGLAFILETLSRNISRKIRFRRH